MFTEKTIGFIGGGNMGGAMINGLIKSGMIDPKYIIVADLDENRLQQLADEHGIATTTDNKEVCGWSDILIISVKPQVIDKILTPKDAANRDFILSVAAGVPIQRLKELFSNPAIVRCMPNTPAMIGQGMAVWTATDAVNDLRREQAGAMLGCLGRQVYVSEESLLDAATALSGSGPAYVFLMIEAMIEAGVHMGFSRTASQEIVLQTFKGSVEYAIHSGENIAVLRNQVTSSAGTTAEALYHMEKEGLRHAIARGVWAAFERSVNLGGGKGRNPG